MKVPSTGLTCHFSIISEGLSLGVQFQSDNGGKSYGGWITIYTPAETGPVTTGLWDSDGNVFFTICQTDGQSNLVINSGSVPGSYEPHVVVQQASGLSGEITQTGSDPATNTYEYTITVQTATNQPDAK